MEKLSSLVPKMWETAALEHTRIFALCEYERRSSVQTVSPPKQTPLEETSEQCDKRADVPGPHEVSLGNNSYCTAIDACLLCCGETPNLLQCAVSLEGTNVENLCSQG